MPLDLVMLGAVSAPTTPAAELYAGSVSSGDRIRGLHDDRKEKLTNYGLKLDVFRLIEGQELWAESALKTKFVVSQK